MDQMLLDLRPLAMLRYRCVLRDRPGRIRLGLSLNG